MSSHVIVETDDGVVTVRLDRPPANRLDPVVMDELRTALLDADADESTRAMVLTGSGETFCGGLDAEYLRAGGDPVAMATGLIELLRVFPRLGVPVVAAVNGDALASGFSLVCAADLAVAVADARLGTIESSMGLWPTIAQVPVLRRLLPRHALQNVITGIPFTTQEALRYGAINEIAPDVASLGDAVAAWVERATNSGELTGPGRRAFYRMLDSDWDGALDIALETFMETTARTVART